MLYPNRTRSGKGGALRGNTVRYAWGLSSVSQTHLSTPHLRPPCCEAIRGLRLSGLSTANLRSRGLVNPAPAGERSSLKSIAQP